MANVKENTKPTKKSKKGSETLPIVNPHAAGIDIGDKIHAVAVPPGAAEDCVRTFDTMTCDLNGLTIFNPGRDCNSYVFTIYCQGLLVGFKGIYQIEV